MYMVWWIDSDALVMNASIPLTAFVDDEHDIVAGGTPVC